MPSTRPSSSTLSNGWPGGPYERPAWRYAAAPKPPWALGKRQATSDVAIAVALGTSAPHACSIAVSSSSEAIEGLTLPASLVMRSRITAPSSRNSRTAPFRRPVRSPGGRDVEGRFLHRAIGQCLQGGLLAHAAGEAHRLPSGACKLADQQGQDRQSPQHDQQREATIAGHADYCSRPRLRRIRRFGSELPSGEALS